MMEGRSRPDDEYTPAQEHEDVFADENEVDYIDGPTDGFRPNVNGEHDAGDDDFVVTDGPSRNASVLSPPSPLSPALPTLTGRNSIRKSRSHGNPFDSPQDNDPEFQEREQTLDFEPDPIAHRSISSASSHVYAQTSSPRFGAGPSHPYGMYHQSTMARSPSVATTSTIRPTPRQSQPADGPQHPYSMYPQAVDEDMNDEDEPARQAAVPVGFPGLGQNYTRRLGPDGEDQDIIGEDGHAEQLPPYSRYPEEVPEKAPLLAPIPPAALHSRAPVAGTDPGMPLMHTAIRAGSTAAPQSMSDQSALLDSPHSSVSHLVRTSSRLTSSESQILQEKTWNEKNWKEKHKTRFCGVPFWGILVTVCVFVFIAAVLAGSIGGYFAGQHATKNPSSATTTSLYDARPIASPTSGSPPQGTFALNIGPPQKPQSDCVPPNQQIAWKCDLVPNSALGLVVGTMPHGSGSGARLFYASHNTSIVYGSQLSMMNTSLSTFITVLDNTDPNSGPAFYFQQFYDKVVVLPEEAISLDAFATNSAGQVKRQGYYNPDFEIPASWSQRKQLASPGDTPWFCIWNATFLEGFIYVQQPASGQTSPAASPTYPPTTSSHSPAETTPVDRFEVPPMDFTSTVIANPLTTATYEGPVSQFPSWLTSSYKAVERQSAFEQPGFGQDFKRIRGISPNDPWSRMNEFPYVIKIEERRLPDRQVPPYCQQYKILDNYQANWLPDKDNNPIIVTLNETDPSYSAYKSAGLASRSDPTHSKRIPGGCHCQWMGGQ